MRIGLISDIHGNLAALERALTLLRDQQKVDTILCAGDLVERHADGNAVVALMREQQIPTVQGNHDAAAERNQAWLAQMAGDIFPFGGPGETLSDETLAYLADLPLMRRLVFEDRRVLVAHASPWDQATYIMPRGNPNHYRRIADETDADVVVLGHTHMPMVVRLRRGSMLVVNPGSVGDPRNEMRVTCAVLTLPDMLVAHYSVETGEPVRVPPVKM